MPDRPYTVLSAAVSLDGFLGSGTRERLMLSGEADLDRVDAVRASCDAILVGARTVRLDDPRLLVRSPQRRAERMRAGLPPSPLRVTLTRSGRIDPGSRFFGPGAPSLVYCARPAAPTAAARLAGCAEVVDAGPCLDLAVVGADLHRRGVRRLMVEGGATVLTALLTAGLADELQLAVAPVFVGDPAARRLVGAGAFPWTGASRAALVGVERAGDVAVMRYALSARCDGGSDAPVTGAGAATGAPVALPDTAAALAGARA